MLIRKLVSTCATGVLAAVTVLGAAPQTAGAATVVTGHTGSGTPALAQAGDRLYVAWTGSTGTPSAKGLNLGWSTSGGKNIVKVSNPEKTPQQEGPALVANPDAPGVIMAFPDGRNGNTLTLVAYDGAAFSCRTSFTGITTPHSPALAVDSSGKLYVAWTGADKHLNIALIISEGCATNATHTMTMLNRSALSQTSPYGPGLVFDTTLRTTLRMVVSWVADDAAHTVYAATWPGSTTLINLGTADPGVHATSTPTIWIGYDDLYMAVRGADNHQYTGFSGGQTPPHFQLIDSGYVVSSGIGADVHNAHTAWFNATGNLVIA